jgi:predicted transcriptional regulator
MDMDDLIYHIKIKKEYASSIIEDLQQVDAIEIMEEIIPEWQKQESLKRLAEMIDNPGSVIEEDRFFDTLENDNEKL